MTLNLYSNLPYANDVKEVTMLNQNLSAKLKNHRKSVWMTQKQLSDKSGVSLTEIRNIERKCGYREENFRRKKRIQERI